MKKLLLILCIIFVYACNSPEEYKGIVTDKKINNTFRTTMFYNPFSHICQPLFFNDIDHILVVKDSLNDERKYVVSKNTYNEINIGDKYFE